VGVSLGTPGWIDLREGDRKRAAARLEAVEDRLAAHPGLYVAGNAYQGIGLPDCIASGERAAERLLEKFAF
jgi:hypothetical protein